MGKSGSAKGGFFGKVEGGGGQWKGAEGLEQYGGRKSITFKHFEGHV
jgi:hypothetical protein